MALEGPTRHTDAQKNTHKRLVVRRHTGGLEGGGVLSNSCQIGQFERKIFYFNGSVSVQFNGQMTGRAVAGGGGFLSIIGVFI